jgi:conjugative transfer signal peptidase TraF
MPLNDCNRTVISTWIKSHHKVRTFGILAATGLGFCLVAASFLTPALPLLVWNASASVPLGFYRMSPGTIIERGSFVLARLPTDARALADERGYLPAAIPIIKPVAALEGDTICVRENTVSINGHFIATRLQNDHKNRPLSSWMGCRTLDHQEVFLLAPDVSDSFDGRYFGPTNASEIIGKVVPLWTF